MMDDKALHEAFDTLRTHDELRAPSFDGIVRRSVPPLRHRRLIGLAVSALSLFLAMVAFEVGHRRVPGDHKGGTQFILAWRAPTDFLLDTPGSQLMRDVPEIHNPDPMRRPPL